MVEMDEVYWEETVDRMVGLFNHQVSFTMDVTLIMTVIVDCRIPCFIMENESHENRVLAKYLDNRESKYGNC